MRTCLFALLLFIAACEPPVLFTEPQPLGQSPLDHFPKRWQGMYLLMDDSSLLEIGSRVMRRMDEWELRMPLSDLDSSTRTLGDTLLVTGDGVQVPVTVRGDSVFGTVSYTDTIFVIGGRHLLKRMSGSLFMNHSHNGSGWEVTRLSLSKGRLRFSEIKDPESLAVINEEVELPGDTISAPLVVTRKQFRRIMNRSGFILEKEYVRVRKR